MPDSNARILKRDYGFDVAATRREVLRLARVQPGQHVLDIGTGQGSMAFVLARRGIRVTGIDNDRDALREARARAARASAEVRERIRFKFADALSLPFPSGRFDGVFSFDTLHHLSHCPKAVDEMLRVCRPMGVTVIADLNRQGLRAIDEVMARYGDEHYHNRCRISVIGQILKRRGLRCARYALPFVTVFVVATRNPELVRGR